MIKTLQGGSTGQAYHFGPGKFKSGYSTVRNGWAEDITCGKGEVVVLIYRGSPHSFAVWVAGSINEVISYLQVKGKADLAERIKKDPRKPISQQTIYNDCT